MRDHMEKVRETTHYARGGGVVCGERPGWVIGVYDWAFVTCAACREGGGS